MILIAVIAEMMHTQLGQFRTRYLVCLQVLSATLLARANGRTEHTGVAQLW